MVLPTIIVIVASVFNGLADANSFVKRPVIQPSPLQPYKPFSSSAPRTKTCFVRPSGSSQDDSPAILAALKKCNNGGTVVLNKEYNVCSTLDLRFLKHVDVALTGTVKFCDNVDSWVSNNFQYPFQDGSSWWLWGGKDINLYGAGVGTIDGNGQAWYDANAKNSSVKRPTLFVADGWHGGSITGLRLRQSPNVSVKGLDGLHTLTNKWHNFIANSSDILISDIDIFSRSTSENFAKNLDGWDTYRSDNIVIQNSYINHDDDCVSFKPNSTNVIVQGLICNSSHGISVGSLGQYPGTFDIIENLYIYNISMSNASDGARLKVWPGEGAVTHDGWIGGGGAGYVRNVTYDTFHHKNNDGAIKIDQCYGAVNASTCEDHPSGMTLTDILFKDFWGTISTANDPVVGSLICSSQDSCDNIQAQNVTVVPPSGKPAQWKCRNMDKELLDLNGVGCVDG